MDHFCCCLCSNDESTLSTKSLERRYRRLLQPSKAHQTDNKLLSPNVREIPCRAAASFPSPTSFHARRRLLSSGRSPVCVCVWQHAAAPQGQYSRQSTLNIHQALLLVQADDDHIQQCSSDQRELIISLSSSAEITNQWPLSEPGLRFCLSQHTVCFGRRHFLIPFPLTRCWFESLFWERPPLIAMRINEDVWLIYL